MIVEVCHQTPSGPSTTVARWRESDGEFQAAMSNYAESFKCGGSHEYVTLALGYEPVPLSARLLAGKGGAVLEEWQRQC